MSWLAVRFLALTSTLLLVLPPGWCMAGVIAWPTQARPKVNPCCCCKESSQPERPDPKPSPSQPLKICCCRGDLTVSPTFQIDVRNLVVSPVWNTTGDSDFRSGTAYADGRGCFALPVPVHLANCVWRC